MGAPVVVAYDIGTSGIKAVVVDGAGRVLGARNRTYGLRMPQPGWAEQDVEDMVAELGRASCEVLEATRTDPGDVAAVGLTAQMFNVVPLDGRGRPLGPMLSWLDQRSRPQAEALRRSHSDGGYGTWDTVLTAKDVIPRIAWLMEERPAIANRAAWFVDCKEALFANLTGEVAIDPAGASAFRLTGANGQWDAERCRAAGIDVARLAPIVPAEQVAGRMTRVGAELTGLREGTPVVVGAGDVPASQLGSGAVNSGDTHLSLGTAVYFGITLDGHRADPCRQLGPLRHIVPGQEVLWLEIATGGAALSWIERQLAGLLAPSERPSRDHAAVDAAVTGAADGMEDLLFLPWLTGERVPLFDDSARASFVGLALHHGPQHLVRAVMEGVACQIAWAYEYGSAYGVAPGVVRAVGGGSIGAVWTTIIAETLGRPIEIVGEPQEAAARGAAACALVGGRLAADVRTAVPARVERRIVPSPSGVRDGSQRLRRFRELAATLVASWMLCWSR